MVGMRELHSVGKSSFQYLVIYLIRSILSYKEYSNSYRQHMTDNDVYLSIHVIQKCRFLS